MHQYLHKMFHNFPLSIYHEQVGDRVGVQRRADSSLHFYINGADLGVAAFDVPAGVYGVVSVFGNTEQVTISDTHGK